MSRNSREEILRRIKTGLQDLDANQEKPPLFSITDGNKIGQRVIELREELEEKKWVWIDRFIDELRRVSGNVIVVKDENEVRESIIKLIEKHSVRSLAIWESDLLLSLRELLQNKGLQFVSSGNKDDMAKADIGITEVDYAIAETGTIVLIANERQPRSVSLIPPIHIAVMKSNTILGNLDELFFLVKNSSQPTSCMTFITGPSRTADIELNLTLGVHGPKELYVLIYP
jgi:L-lactate dehydrogenase complex protein LldG